MQKYDEIERLSLAMVEAVETARDFPQMMTATSCAVALLIVSAAKTTSVPASVLLSTFQVQVGEIVADMLLDQSDAKAH